MVVPLVLEDSPNTAMIIGAVLSGGDVLTLAEALVRSEAKASGVEGDIYQEGRPGESTLKDLPPIGPR